MAYNMTAFDDAYSFYDIFKGANDVTQTQGLLSTIILVITFIILFILFKDRVDTQTILLGASFITLILASLFWVAGFIGLNILLVPVALTVISIILFFTNT